MKSTIKLLISTFILMNCLILANVIAPTELGYITEKYFDFEENLIGWEEYTSSTGSNIYITENTAYQGASSVKLTSKTVYAYNFANEAPIRFSTNTLLSYAWKYANIEGYYFGMIIVTTGPNLYIMNYFSGTYANTSDILIIQYKNELVNTWYHHTMNLSRIYLDYYDVIPENITHLELINRGYGATSDGVGTNQISYFDSIYISAEGETYISPPPTTNENPTIQFPGFNSLIGLSSIFMLSITYLVLNKRRK